MQRFRAASIALAILALSATAVLAAGPVSVLPNHAQPSASASHRVEAVESNEPTDAPEASEVADASNAPDGSPSASHPVNHGCVVSLAAQTATPSGFKNHGQWVRSIAKMNHGHGAPDPTACVLPTAAPTAGASSAPSPVPSSQP